MQNDIHEIGLDVFPRLKEIADPPERLWYRGTLPSPDTVFLTVVGSRKFSTYGKEVMSELIGGLSGYDITIVSGLALGTDANAHNAALEAGLMTIGAPGSGLDRSVLYPRSNLQLAERIVKEGGGLLSEFTPDFRATLWSFPMRNRIMAGLAQATLIIEATDRSGTLITARLATEYNRDVFAVPGSIFSPSSEGTNRLIAQGATPIMSSKDLLMSLGFSTDDMSEKVELDLSRFPDEERMVLELLTEPTDRETLLAKTGLSASSGSILLMKLEIAGHIKDTPEGIRRMF